MNSKKANITIIILLVASFNFLALGTIGYSLENDVTKVKYSDTLEYSTITDGLLLINELPIQFNISNEYFSGFDNLAIDIRESILMAYLLKNNIGTYKCENGTGVCINKDSLKDSVMMKKFNTKTEIISNSIKLYVDDYGKHSINTNNSTTFYKVVLDDDNHNYRKYSRFAKYKEEKDLYIFYVYEGYYKGNCQKGEKLKIYDFLSGEAVYTGICDGNNDFVEKPGNEVEKLQLYKYELKKNEDGEFYLYGYNPVNKM